MAPLLSRLGVARGGFGFDRRKVVSATPTGLIFPSNALFAYSGDGDDTDLTGNANTIINNPGYSGAQAKWGSYSESFYVNGTGYSRVETPVFEHTGEWSIEFWCYATIWAGDYLLTSGTEAQNPSGPAINVQADQFRTYGGFFSNNRVDYSITTSTLLNQWNFWQIYRNGSTTRYVLNGSEITNCGSNANEINHLVFGNKEPSDNTPITGYFNDIVVYEGGASRGQQSVPTTPFGL